MKVSDTTTTSRPASALLEPQSPLDELASRIQHLTRVPALGEVESWFSALAIRARDYDRHRVFTERKYARNLIARSEYAELLLLCWRAGQRTPIHDHGGSIGVVMVCEGWLTETMYERCQDGRVRPYNTQRWPEGGITGADVPDIHQLLNLHTAGQDMVTLHCYAPPLSILNTFSHRSSRVGRWREGCFMSGAGI